MTNETDADTDASCLTAELRPAEDEAGADGVLGPHFRWITIGMCALVLFVAFEAMAVTTVMPVIARELHGDSLYTLAFAGSTAVSVVGMVTAGAWCDRRGPVRPLLVAVVLFVLGLAIAGLAPTMPVLVAGRLVQGFGGGALTVALYVAVARWYPPRLHPLVFVGFSTSWVLPSLAGPFVAGVVTQAFGWRWVFLGVIVVALVGLLMIRRVLVDTGAAPAADAAPLRPARIAAALAAALALLVLGSATQFGTTLRWIVLAVAAAVLVAALRPLMPVGTFRLAMGLPAVLLARMLLTGAELASEVYVPYLLIDRYGLSPAIAGLALSGSAVAWSAGSWAQGRLGPRASERGWAVLGAASIVLGVAGTTAVAALGLPAWWLFGLYLFAGLGMGLALPRLTVLMIGYSTPADQGFNSSAQAIADAVGGSAAVAFAGLVFAALQGAGGSIPFAACFALCTVLALIALGASARVGSLSGARRAGA
ncbi:MFS transporter [Gryllotalpicola koreensis]|uniref:MFS transporter n=1 Tax=Gryllotalpicola koreensis TaxID=993086 RepID=A0ABP7ZVF9_9MICO